MGIHDNFHSREDDQKSKLIEIEKKRVIEMPQLIWAIKQQLRK